MSRTWGSGALVAALTLLPAGLRGAAQAPASRGPAAVRTCSIAEYRDHLARLSTLIAACQAHMDATQCDAGSVGPDDAVEIRAGARRVSYGWVRSVLRAAADVTVAKDRKAAGERSGKALDEAAARLREALAAGSGVAVFTAPPAGAGTDRARLAAILSRHEFARVEQPGLLRRAWDAFLQWCFRKLAGVAGYSSRSRWIAYLFRALVIAIPGTLLLLWFLRRVRRQGMRVAPPEAVELRISRARDGQFWRERAQQLAAEGRWREAVHSVYWAAIARLEGYGAWPADGARTPREYLRLVSPGSERHGELLRLTRSFEGIWYGGRYAAESDFAEAFTLLERLGAR